MEYGGTVFSSSCATRRVPQSELVLVCIKLVGDSTSSTGMLFDGRRSVAELDAEVRDACGDLAGRPGRRAVIFARSGILGALRGSVGTLLRSPASLLGRVRGTACGNAFRDHVVPSLADAPVCVEAACAKYRTEPKGSPLYHSLAYFTNHGSPTRNVHHSARCSRADDCCCFLVRAANRAKAGFIVLTCHERPPAPALTRVHVGIIGVFVHAREAHDASDTLKAAQLGAYWSVCVDPGLAAIHETGTWPKAYAATVDRLCKYFSEHELLAAITQQSLDAVMSRVAPAPRDLEKCVAAACCLVAICAIKRGVSCPERQVNTWDDYAHESWSWEDVSCSETQ